MVKRGLCYVIGLFILSSGVSLVIKADLGAPGWDALNVGLSEQIGLTVGSWVFIVGVILIAINAWILRERPEFSALLTIVVLGGLIDFWLLFAFANLVLTDLVWQIFVLCIGIALVAFGASTYLQAYFGKIPVDGLMMAIHRKTGYSLMKSKTMVEILAVLLAFLFGGPIGVGTVFVTLLIGPLIQAFFTPLERLVHADKFAH